MFVTGTRMAPKAMDSVSAVTVAADEESDDSNIVVSGSQRRGSRAARRRGDWNACTVNDPEQSLRGCKSLLGTGKRGAGGAAAAHLSEGLAKAWQGDWSGAIERFDQAIALQPRLAFAYLNRGLARQQLGEMDRAAADLDLAIRNAPQSARGYYQRSLVRRMRGDERGASADMARAETLDPRYGALAD